MSQRRRKSSIDYETEIARYEHLLRQGKATEVARELRAYNLTLIPRISRLPLARLSRRVGNSELALKILKPAVRQEAPLEEPASRLETAEYAASLQRIGAVVEALQLLDPISSAEVPEAPLYRAFCYMNTWDYDQAIPHLEEYVKVATDPYQVLVGKVNLAAALSAVESFDKALTLLHQLNASTRAGSHWLLNANSNEILAQIHVYQGHFAEAEECLERAEAVLGASGLVDQLFVEKWKAILAASKTSSLEPLINFRRLALERNVPETIRDVDFYGLKINFQERGYEHLYFGTPYRSFRDRLRRTFGRAPLSDFYLYGNPAARCFDPETLELDGRPLANPGDKLRRLTSLLLRDLYKPIASGDLYSRLFPGEHFNAYSSPLRIRQLVHRARSWYNSESLPIDIVAHQGSYSLKIESEFAFRLSLKTETLTANDSYLNELRNFFAGKERDSFTAREACEALKMSKPRFKRFIDECLSRGTVVRIGSGPSSAYRFQSPK